MLKRPSKLQTTIYFEANDVVVRKWIPDRVIRGDCVFQLGFDFTL